MLRNLALVLIAATTTFGAVAAVKVVKTAPGSVTGELSYSAAQFWIRSGNEDLCVMMDATDEAWLEELVGSTVSFDGPIQTWPDKSRCIVVGPDFPSRVEAAAKSRGTPVIIGAHGQGDLDACLGVGAILSPVAVRNAPDASAAAAMSVTAGREVYLCGPSADGAWESVVVPGRAGEDCGVSRAVAAPTPYEGLCKSGWVPGRNLQVVAG